jgi:hypothetical protein
MHLLTSKSKVSLRRLSRNSNSPNNFCEHLLCRISSKSEKKYKKCGKNLTYDTKKMMVITTHFFKKLNTTPRNCVEIFTPNFTRILFPVPFLSNMILIQITTFYVLTLASPSCLRTCLSSLSFQTNILYV